MNNKQDKGFTLVELLIVIVILGILATVTVFAVRGITEKSQDNACAVEKRAIETGIEAFYVDSATQSFPANLAALQTGGFVKTAPDAAVWTYTVDNAVPTYTLAAAGGTAKCAGTP